MLGKCLTQSTFSVIMDDSSYRLNFGLGKKSITTARKSILKSVKLQSLVAKCCKMRKI